MTYTGTEYHHDPVKSLTLDPSVEGTSCETILKEDPELSLLYEKYKLD